MWIGKEEKEEYLDCSVRGLRLKFFAGLTEAERNACKSFADWLRRYYFFPIRIYVCLVPQKAFYHPDDGHIYYGVFYSGEAEKRKIYPRICIAARAQTPKAQEDVLLAMAHELTHYFQWYFLEDEARTDRSLEVEAGKWARYLVAEYLSEKGTKLYRE